MDYFDEFVLSLVDVVALLLVRDGLDLDYHANHRIQHLHQLLELSNAVAGLKYLHVSGLSWVDLRCYHHLLQLAVPQVQVLSLVLKHHLCLDSWFGLLRLYLLLVFLLRLLGPLPEFDQAFLGFVTPLQSLVLHLSAESQVWSVGPMFS